MAGFVHGLAGEAPPLEGIAAATGCDAAMLLVGGLALGLLALAAPRVRRACGGLVGAVAFANGWLSGDWLVIIALALTMTFIAAAPLNAMARKIVTAVQPRVSRFERPCLLPEDVPIDPGDARFAIIGMARLGAGAYDTLKAQYGDVLIGSDPDPSVVARHQAEGRNVILADATSDDFWFRVAADHDWW